jgi:hypothetical protein
MKHVFEDNLDLTNLRDRLTEFIQLIYYKYVNIEYNIEISINFI